MQCEGDIEVFPPVPIANPQKAGFVENALFAATAAYNNGIQVLCIHTDSDNKRDDEAFNARILPALKAITEASVNICNNLVAIVPVHMSEAWMLADKELLKDEIGTNRRNADLGIAQNAEAIADPKTAIENALRIALVDKPSKTRNISIKDLYQPMGQKIPLEKLEALPSYEKFRQSVEAAFRRLNYLH